MKKKLILVASPPACGKTYVSELVAGSMKQMVYLDKDDLGKMIRTAFAVSGNEVNMDGDFYKENLRDVEYTTILDIAFSALRFEKYVLLNAPFIKEVRDIEYMRALKEKANDYKAQLFLIWVTASPEICHERMIKRNSDRDLLKLQNWDEYVKTINFTPPYELEKENAVDKLIVFDANDDKTTKCCLSKTLKEIRRKL